MEYLAHDFCLAFDTKSKMKILLQKRMHQGRFGGKEGV
jgi:hypothetical protein